MQAQRLSGAEGLKFARGFRFAVSLMLLALLWWFLLGVLERQTQRAEEQSANMVINQLRASLVIKGAEVMLSRGERLKDQEGINPFELIEHQWPSYAGLCQRSKPEPGTWCFWRHIQKETVTKPEGWLIYTPNQPITLYGRAAEAGEPLAWMVATEFADRNKNGRREQKERTTGLKLAPVSLTEDTVLVQDAER